MSGRNTKALKAILGEMSRSVQVGGVTLNLEAPSALDLLNARRRSGLAELSRQRRIRAITEPDGKPDPNADTDKAAEELRMALARHDQLLLAAALGCSEREAALAMRRAEWGIKSPLRVALYELIAAPEPEPEEGDGEEGEADSGGDELDPTST